MKQLLPMANYSDDMIGVNLRFNPISVKTVKKIVLRQPILQDPLFWNNGCLALAIERYTAYAKHSGIFKNSTRLLGDLREPRLVDNFLYVYAYYDHLTPGYLRTSYEFLSAHPRDGAGSILYRIDNDSAFLDTIGMVCPFLMRYGLEQKNQAATDLALEQFRAFMSHGLDSSSGLLYHGYNFGRSEKNGIIGWGRGMGWMLFGLAESIKYTNKGSKDRDELMGYLHRLIEASLCHEKAIGGFSWQLQAKDGALDTSATSMLGYSLLCYSKYLGASGEIYSETLDRLVRIINDNIENGGKVVQSSAECQGFSMYPQVFGNNSWGQAFSMLFLTEYYASTNE